MGRTTEMLTRAVEAARSGQKVLVIMGSRSQALAILECASEKLPGFRRSAMRIDTRLGGYLKVMSAKTPGLGVGFREQTFLDHAARSGL